MPHVTISTEYQGKHQDFHIDESAFHDQGDFDREMEGVREYLQDLDLGPNADNVESPDYRKFAFNDAHGPFVDQVDRMMTKIIDGERESGSLVLAVDDVSDVTIDFKLHK